MKPVSPIYDVSMLDVGSTVSNASFTTDVNDEHSTLHVPLFTPTREGLDGLLMSTQSLSLSFDRYENLFDIRILLVP